MAALAVALLCFGAVSVAGNVEEAVAATTKDGKKAVSKDASKKQSVAKGTKSAAKASKASATSKDKKKAQATASKDKKKSQAVASASGKNKSKKQTASTRKSKNKKNVKSKNVSERDVWMQRAQNSSELLGKASWYGADFHGGPTASGAEYDMNSYTAAHRTLPLGTVVEVTEEDTGRSVLVCINNRGPFKAGRVIDLSQAAAKDLGIKQRGIAPVNLKVLTDSEGQPLNTEEAFYVRLVRKQNAQEERVGPFSQYADASVMRDVLRNQYPEASVVLGPVASK